jgi:hypothetical protein
MVPCVRSRCGMSREKFRPSIANYLHFFTPKSSSFLPTEMENMGSDSASDQTAPESCAKMISIPRNVLQAKDEEIAALRNQVTKLTKTLDTIDKCSECARRSRSSQAVREHKRGHASPSWEDVRPSWEAEVLIACAMARASKGPLPSEVADMW